MNFVKSLFFALSFLSLIPCATAAENVAVAVTGELSQESARGLKLLVARELEHHGKTAVDLGPDLTWVAIVGDELLDATRNANATSVYVLDMKIAPVGWNGNWDESPFTRQGR